MKNSVAVQRRFDSIKDQPKTQLLSQFLDNDKSSHWKEAIVCSRQTVIWLQPIVSLSLALQFFNGLFGRQNRKTSWNGFDFDGQGSAWIPVKLIRNANV